MVLPFELARKESNMSRLVLVKRVAAGLHVVDPLSNEVCACLSVCVDLLFHGFCVLSDAVDLSNRREHRITITSHR